METSRIREFKSLSLAALLIASATFAACSSSDDNIIEEQPVQPKEKVYTMTVQATKGDAAGTRGLSLDGKTLNVKWYEGEKVIVAQDEATIGTLTAQASNNGTTTLTGEVTGLDPNKDVSFYLHSVNRRYNSIYDGLSHIDWEQKGVLQKPAEGTDHSIETSYDFAACTVSKEKISINGTEISVAGGIALASRQAIVKFTLLDQDGNALDDVYRLKIKTTKGNYLTLTSSYMNAPELGDEFFAEIEDASTNEVFMAIEMDGKQDVRLIAYIDKGGDESDYYFYDRENVEFVNGKYYEITVKMKHGVYIDHYGYSYNAKNGDVLFGNNTDFEISIADGATVTLHDVHISDDSYIDCGGDATIILEGENSICADNNNPAIWVDQGKTLTIKGTGSLDAENMGWAAAIGGGEKLPCGNIVIESGTIVAKGGQRASGIGSGGHDAYGTDVAELYAQTTCGNIEIKGGHITATGDSYGAGIGCGGRGTCGNITITGGTVVANGADYDSAGIGGANASTCGDITITGGTVTATGYGGCPGIGMGCNGTSTDKTKCGDITIGGTANVTAKKGSSAMHAIGFSYNEEEEIQKTCGTITIGGTVYYNGSTKTWVSETLENALKVATFTWPAP